MSTMENNQYLGLDKVTLFMAWCLMVMTWALIPIHFFVNCRMSGMLCTVALVFTIFAFIVLILGYNIKRLELFFITFIGLIFNGLCSH